MGKRTRDELIQLVRDIAEGNGSEEQIAAWLDELCANVSHPEVSDLIFFSDPALSPEEVVDQAIAYERKVFSV